MFMQAALRTYLMFMEILHAAKLAYKRKINSTRKRRSANEDQLDSAVEINLVCTHKNPKKERADVSRLFDGKRPGRDGCNIKVLPPLAKPTTVVDLPSPVKKPVAGGGDTLPSLYIQRISPLPPSRRWCASRRRKTRAHRPRRRWFRDDAGEIAREKGERRRRGAAREERRDEMGTRRKCSLNPRNCTQSRARRWIWIARPRPVSSLLSRSWSTIIKKMRILNCMLLH